MAETHTLRRPEGTTVTLETIDHPDWTGVDDPCPDCDGTEFDHYRTQGGHLGHRSGTPVTRTDYEATTIPLATRCRTCKTVLFKHPLVDTLAEIPLGDD